MNKLIMDFTINNTENRILRLDTSCDSILNETAIFFADLFNIYKYNLIHDRVYDFFENNNDILLLNANEFSNVRELSFFINNSNYKKIIILNVSSNNLNNLRLKDIFKVLLKNNQKSIQMFGYSNKECLKKIKNLNILHLNENPCDGSGYQKFLMNKYNNNSIFIKNKLNDLFDFLSGDFFLQEKFVNNFDIKKNKYEMIANYIKEEYKDENNIYIMSLICFLMEYNKKNELTFMFEDNKDKKKNFISADYIAYASAFLFDKNISTLDIEKCILYYNSFFIKIKNNNYQIKTYEISFIFFKNFYDKYRDSILMSSFFNKNEKYNKDLKDYVLRSKEVKIKRFFREDYNRENYQSNTLKNIILSMHNNELEKLIKKIIKKEIKNRLLGCKSETYDCLSKYIIGNDYFYNSKKNNLKYNFLLEDFLYYLSFKENKVISKIISSNTFLKINYKKIKIKYPNNISKNEKLKLLELKKENINYKYINSEEEFFKLIKVQLLELKKEIETDKTFQNSILDDCTEKNNLSNYYRIPKDENHIRNLILEKLKIKLNNTIMNKEVEMKNNIRTDIFLQKNNNNQEKIEVIVEAKKFNNKDLLNSPKSQVLKYLNENNINKAIYLTFSFEEDLINKGYEDKDKKNKKCENFRSSDNFSSYYDKSKNAKIEGKINEINKENKTKEICHINFNFS